MFTVEMRDESFRILNNISDRNFDPQCKTRLNNMIGRSNEDIKDELLGLIDDMVFSALSSDFEIKALEIIWLNIGGSQEELNNRNQMISTANNEQMEELKTKYKWQCCNFQ